MLEMIQSNLNEMLVTLLIGLVTYFGARIKAKYEEMVNTEIKQKVVKICVNAVEQLYKDLKGEEKLQIAKENIIEMLNEKGLTISDLEMELMIEEVVNGFNQGFKGE